MAAVEEHEQSLFAVLHDGLAGMGHVTGYGKAARRTPTAYFTVDGRAAGDVARYLAGRGVNVWSGHNYAWELTGILGIRDSGGAVRAGLVHYNDRSDVDRLLEALAGLAG
jgi:selenocysteine lyase/cysteine desulfurase